MAQEGAIRISEAEMERRIRLVSTGSSLEQVSGLLGGAPFQSHQDQDGLKVFWRFSLPDRIPPLPQIELYMGIFVDDTLTFGSILPHASGS